MSFSISQLFLDNKPVCCSYKRHLHFFLCVAEAMCMRGVTQKVCLQLLYSFAGQIIDVILKEKNSILDRDLNPDLLALRANALTNRPFQDVGGSPGELTLIVPRVWEIGYTQPCIKFRGNRQLILFIFEVLKVSPIHISMPPHTFHSKVNAFTNEPLLYLLQALTKISTLYNFCEWRV